MPCFHHIYYLCTWCCRYYSLCSAFGLTELVGLYSVFKCDAMILTSTYARTIGLAKGCDVTQIPSILWAEKYSFANMNCSHTEDFDVLVQTATRRENEGHRIDYSQYKT